MEQDDLTKENNSHKDRFKDNSKTLQVEIFISFICLPIKLLWSAHIKKWKDHESFE